MDWHTLMVLCMAKPDTHTAASLYIGGSKMHILLKTIQKKHTN